MNAVFCLEGELAVGNLYGDGDEDRVVGDLQVIGAPVEVHLIADDARGHYRFQVLELDFGRLLDFGVELKAVELVHAGRRPTERGGKVRAVRAREAIRLRSHAHGFQQAQTRPGNVQERVLFRGIHGQVVFARAAGIDEFQDNVLAYAFQVAPAPGFPWVRSSGASTLFHRSVVGAAGRVRLNFVRPTPHDVHAATIGFPARDARSKMFVRVSNPAVMLFLEIVVREVGIAAAAQPELLDKLLALFVGLQLQEGIALFGSNDVHHVFVEPLLVGAIEFLQGALHLALGVFIQLFRSRQGVWILWVLRLLGQSGWQANGK